MLKKGTLVFLTVVTLGVFDWLLTIVGIIFFGASEANPLLVNLTKTNIIAFSLVKLSAITISGLAFYEATIIGKLKTAEWPWTNRLLDGGYSVISLLLITVVASNVLTIIG
jgi:hypothetical protein